MPSVFSRRFAGRVALAVLCVAVPLALGTGQVAFGAPDRVGGMLTNGGFEAAATGGAAPAGWTANPQAYQATMGWDARVAHTGRRSVRVDLAQGGDAAWTQTVPVEPKTAYRLTGWVRTRGVSDAPGLDGGASIGFFGEWDRSVPVRGTRGWRQVAVSFTTNEQTQVTVAARLGFWGGLATGTAWFDDLRLVRVTNERIVDPGFEAGSPLCGALPLGWGTTGTGSQDLFAWDRQVSRRGHASVRVSAGTPQDGAWVQVVRVRPHTVYRVSGWIRTEGVADSAEPVNAGANLGFYGTWDRSEPVLGTHGWTHVSAVTDSGDQDYLTVAARLGYWAGTTTGSAWFDDLTLAAVGPA